MLDALVEQGRERVPIPDTGSLHGDLLAHGEAIVESLSAPETEALARAVFARSRAASRRRTPTPMRCSRRCWARSTSAC